MSFRKLESQGFQLNNRAGNLVRITLRITYGHLKEMAKFAVYLRRFDEIAHFGHGRAQVNIREASDLPAQPRDDHLQLKYARIGRPGGLYRRDVLLNDGSR